MYGGKMMGIFGDVTARKEVRGNIAIAVVEVTEDDAERTKSGMATPDGRSQVKKEITSTCL